MVAIRNTRDYRTLSKSLSFERFLAKIRDIEKNCLLNRFKQCIVEEGLYEYATASKSRATTS